MRWAHEQAAIAGSPQGAPRDARHEGVGHADWRAGAEGSNLRGSLADGHPPTMPEECVVRRWSSTA